MSLTPVLAIPRNHPVLQWFRHRKILVLEQEIPYSPEELIGSAMIRPKEGLLTDSAFFQLWLSAVIIRKGMICTFWDTTDKPCHLWIGNNILQKWLHSQDALMTGLLYQAITRYMDIVFTNPLFTGYLCHQQDLSQNAFGILYLVRAESVKFNNDAVTVKWLRIADIKKKYRKLDPWSKKIFDYIYENPSLREKLGLYQKKRSISKKTD